MLYRYLHSCSYLYRYLYCIDIGIHIHVYIHICIVFRFYSTFCVGLGILLPTGAHKYPQEPAYLDLRVRVPRQVYPALNNCRIKLLYYWPPGQVV